MNLRANLMQYTQRCFAGVCGARAPQTKPPRGGMVGAPYKRAQHARARRAGGQAASIAYYRSSRGSCFSGRLPQSSSAAGRRRRLKARRRGRAQYYTAAAPRLARKSDVRGAASYTLPAYRRVAKRARRRGAATQRGGRGRTRVATPLQQRSHRLAAQGSVSPNRLAR